MWLGIAGLRPCSHKGYAMGLLEIACFFHLGSSTIANIGVPPLLIATIGNLVQSSCGFRATIVVPWSYHARVFLVFLLAIVRHLFDACSAFVARLLHGLARKPRFLQQMPNKGAYW